MMFRISNSFKTTLTAFHKYYFNIIFKFRRLALTIDEE